MFKMNMTKRRFFSFFIIVSTSVVCKSQDSTSRGFESNRQLFVGINGSFVKDFGTQANYFRGYNEVFGLEQLLAIPSVKSELYTKTGLNYTLDEYPPVLNYNAGIGIGLNLLYDFGDVNFILNGSFSKLVTAGYFTLSTDDPANPFGNKLIKTEKISGTERRTWIKPGIQLKNEINARNSFFIEIDPLFFFQKALKNEVNIEGTTYSILVNNPANVLVKTNFIGVGLNLGFGIQTMYLKNKMSQVGVNFNASKLNMVSPSKLNYMAEIYLSVFL